uniref:Peptidase M16 C-terminal domain-containing protein n=1 Tax=Romanomermis culicivorax TaxID=13658 RepID=A0A915JY57_ROMCU
MDDLVKIINCSSLMWIETLVQQLKNTKFELQNIDKELLDDTEIHPESITLPTARNRVRYDSYANAFKGHKVVRDDSDKITDKNLILKEMINFYDKFYSSDKILVVLSQTNIYQNGEKYMELLSTIPKRKSVATKPYKIGYEIRVPDEKILQLYFPLKKANLAKDASCNYLQYYFFNTKISNGFEWMLTESDLANEVSTSCFWTSWSQKDVVFKISIKLTENGLENTGKALELIFSYLNRIKSKNIEKWVHEEVVKNMDPYATKIKWNLIEFLSEVTMSASMYGLENSLVGAPKIFDVNMIRSMLNNLNANNFNCLHGVPAKGKKLWFLPTQPNKNATYILLAIMVRLPKETFSDIKAYANLMLMIKSMNMLVNQELLAKMSNRGCYNLLINYHHTGIEVLIYSAPENVNFIVDNIFHVLAHKRITKGVLNKARKDFLMAFHYDDFLFAAYKNLFHTVRSIDDQMIEALKGVTFQSIEAMLKVISRQIQIEALVVANIDEKNFKFFNS